MKIEDVTVGQAVIWRHEPRGGYGYIIPVDGVVTRIRSGRVEILVRRRSGEPARVWVKPEKLRARDAGRQESHG